MLLSAEECARLFTSINATDRAWDPHYLEPVTNRGFVARMLRNLKTIYWENEDPQRSLRALDQLVALEPNVTRDLMERGIVNHRLGRLGEALSDLSGYVASDPADPDLAAVEELMGRIRRSLG
jgi:regulator of sirC expression with transglutaminase-like and TPR domain